MFAISLNIDPEKLKDSSKKKKSKKKGSAKANAGKKAEAETSQVSGKEDQGES